MVQAWQVNAGMGWLAGWGGGWLLPACTRDQMRWEVSYEAISTSNRTVQRGSRFAKPRLSGPGR